MEHTVKAYLHWECESWEKEPHFEFWKYQMPPTQNRVFISEHDFTINVPDDFDPLPQVIAGLKAEKQRIIAESYVQAAKIEDQIQRLLCIENKP